MKIQLPQKRWKRFSLYFLSFLFIFFAGILLFREKIARDSAREFEEISERLDREDPGWRWEDYQHRNSGLPEEKNSNVLLLKIHAIKASSSLPSRKTSDREWLPGKMPAKTFERVSKYLEENKERILLARQLENYPSGWLAPKWYDVNGDINEIVKNRDLAAELLWDVAVNSELNHFEDCLRDIRALRNLARSCGEGGLGALGIRIPVISCCLEATQQMLSQGVLQSDNLELLQKELLEESRHGLSKKCLRTERARSLFWMKKISEQFSPLVNWISLWNRRRVFPAAPKQNSKLNNMLVALRYQPYSRSDQAFVLRHFTEMIDFLDKPWKEVRQNLRLIDKEMKELEEDYPQAKRLLSVMIYSPCEYWFQEDLKYRASLRATVCGLAAERFRIANKRWPNNLAELVPRYLAQVEEDPYTLKPLLFNRVNNGIVIYSVGEDLEDDGGDVLGVDSERFTTGYRKSNRPADIGFRLWDVDKRGK